MTATAPPLRFDHMALPVGDLRAAHAFYVGLLGFEVVDALEGAGWSGRDWRMLIVRAGDGRQLALTALEGWAPAHATEVDELPHYAFSCDPEAWEGWRARLADAGVTASEEDHGGQRSLYFPDPDGRVLEITAPASGEGDAKAARVVVERWLR